jgi:hypothetical protein
MIQSQVVTGLERPAAVPEQKTAAK